MRENGRENGFRAIGGLAQRLTSGLAKGRSTSIARLRVDWPAIVGADLARCTEPEALIAGRGGRAGGKLLRLRVSGAAALEVQHMSGQIVERVNAYLGHRQVEDIRLMQGPIARAAARRPPPQPAPETVARVDHQVASVKDPELRAALARLGARIATGRPPGRRGVMLGLLGTPFAARALRAQTDDSARYLDEVPGDHVLGKPDAPNIIIDYFSLTCPHCANFNAAVLPAIRRDWIDPGKVKLVMRHFPSDAIATHASLFAECAGAARFYETIDALFRAQVDWLTASEPDVEMMKVLAGLGVGAAAAKACLVDDRLLNKVIADVQSGQALQVKSTPSLFINQQFYGMPGDGAAGIASILRQVGR